MFALGTRTFKRVFWLNIKYLLPVCGKHTFIFKLKLNFSTNINSQNLTKVINQVRGYDFLKSNAKNTAYDFIYILVNLWTVFKDDVTVLKKCF